MELDETGFPQPTGELDELEADSVVLALGQEADLSLLEGVSGVEVEDGVVQVGPNMMTGHARRLRGRRHGPRRAHRDRRRRPRQEGGAQHRRLAARSGIEPRGPSTRSSPSTSSTPGTTPTRRKALQPELEIERRRSTFDEVVGGLDESNAMYEARRCMSCGNCFSCDNCFGVCPDNAVMKLAEAAENPNVNGYAIDLDFCKGCGLCVQECPCGAIEMVPEKI